MLRSHSDYQAWSKCLPLKPAQQPQISAFQLWSIHCTGICSLRENRNFCSSGMFLIHSTQHLVDKDSCLVRSLRITLQDKDGLDSRNNNKRAQTPQGVFAACLPQSPGSDSQLWTARKSHVTIRSEGGWEGVPHCEWFIVFLPASLSNS